MRNGRGGVTGDPSLCSPLTSTAPVTTEPVIIISRINPHVIIIKGATAMSGLVIYPADSHIVKAHWALCRPATLV